LSSACWFGSFNVHLFGFTSSIHPHVCKYVNACNCFARIALRYLAYRDRSSLWIASHSIYVYVWDQGIFGPFGSSIKPWQ
jgi:hypothetical protein